MMNILYKDQNLDITQLGKDELLKIKLSLEVELDEIKQQIDEAKMEVKLTGKYSNPAWFRSITRTQKHKSKQVQAIMLEIRKHNEISKNNHKLLMGKPFSTYFMETAREHLPQKDYERLLILTRQRIEDARQPSKLTLDESGKVW